MKIAVIIVCTDDEQIDSQIGIPDRIVRREVRGKRPCSTPRLVNPILLGEDKPDAWVILHPDVRLPAGWFDRLESGLAQLSEIDANYGVCGVMGCGLLDTKRFNVGHLWDRNYEAGIPLAYPQAVDALDEVCVILRGDRQWRLDENGLCTYHLWASELCMFEAQQGRNNYVLPGLFLEHYSTSSFHAPDDVHFWFNLGVLSERYRKPKESLITPSGSVYDHGDESGVRLC
jgi:hypothetical protein